jgi:uncharacterized lipoprotein YddW (UPF0748 family)
MNIPSKLGLWLITIVFAAGTLSSCTSKKALTQTSSTPIPATQEVMREFRAAWVATVANINWPSKPGLSTDAQKKEAIELLDFLKNHNFNAVIFQVRPQGDALYDSKLEPWSYYLSGKQGVPPSPFYDPLEFWVEEAHKRGLELHVWLNPYRAHHTAGSDVTEHSVVKTMPESVVFLEQGFWWFDPSLKSTQDHSAAVVRDLVKRYDIDGVHFDDYFYPYDSYNNGKDFPDDKSWAAYLESGGKLSRADWRRSHVNTFIERVYNEIKAEKKHVKFGLSPFGIWRPGYPESIQGLDQYNSLYADAKLWLNKGWIDYFTPQLYWPISKIEQSFPVLLGWWQSENTLQRHLWPGMSVAKGGDEANVIEVNNQIMITRGMVPQSKGAVHWSISSLTRNPRLPEGLIKGPYKKPALIPASPWLSNVPPSAPKVNERKTKTHVNLDWSHQNESAIFNWVVYAQYGELWEHQILPKNTKSIALPIQKEGTETSLNAVKVVAVDRFGNASSH